MPPNAGITPRMLAGNARHGKTRAARKNTRLRAVEFLPLWTLAGGALIFASGCGTDEATPGPDAGALSDPVDPAICGGCHQDHFTDWSGSMHAYASEDPVFLAMNARGQRETNGALGTFCVKCHAPMAVLAGKTTDGLNLAELDAAYKNVTCYFCHSVDAVDAAHPFNGAVTLASDGIMRGEYPNPVPNAFHASKYSPYQDAKNAENAVMCGTCHDIVSPEGGHIERTFAEWRASAFSSGSSGVTTCAASGCHMVEEFLPRPLANIAGLPLRIYHDHDFPAVDQALTPFPNTAQTLAEQIAVAVKLANSMQGALCVTAAGGIRVILDTVGLGHDFPSGASQDRRLWTEVIAYDVTDAVIYQSGVVPDGTSPVDVKNDPDMWLLRDCMFDAQGGQVDMFWNGATTDGNELPPLTTFDSTQTAFYQPHKVRSFPRGGIVGSGAQAIDHVTLRVRLQPIGLDVLNDLVSTKDLDPGLVAAVPPPLDIPLGIDSPETLTWTAGAAADSGITPYTDPTDGTQVMCVGTLPNAAAQFPAPTHSNAACSP
jgi:hypothetical protein